MEEIAGSVESYVFNGNVHLKFSCRSLKLLMFKHRPLSQTLDYPNIGRSNFGNLDILAKVPKFEWPMFEQVAG